jgi:hypothetical protein
MRHTLFLLLLPLGLVAQIDLRPALPEVRDLAGERLAQAWLGGLNAPQYQSADLDGDGTKDLIVFDRAGDALVALRGDGGGNYSVAPELAAGFPTDLTAWLLLRDYDGDGNDDLFTFSDAGDGFRVFRGRREGGRLTYSDEATYLGLRYPFNNGTIPIFVTPTDYPAVADIDGDGDLDILTFSAGGGYLEYFRNQSVEEGFGRDTLIYTLEDECWGGFFESGLSSALDLGSGPDDCFGMSPAESPLEFRHAGSTTLALDYNGDGVQDIMLGDVSFNYIVLGLNNGTTEEAWIAEQDATWPSDGVTVDVTFFPGIYHLDVDQDGARDLVAAPSQTLNAEDMEVGWYYRNRGSDARPDFDFQQKDWLVGSSIDLGTAAHPAVLDYDADGRPDLVIANREAYNDDFIADSRLHLYRNVTPAGGPVAFRKVDDDFLGFSRYQSTGSAYSPAFGDLDGDGDTDMVVGQRSGELLYLENTAGPGAPPDFADPVFEFQGIDAGQLSRPAIADLDRDGRADLVVGGFDGRIRYYRNVGDTGTPRFNPDLTAAGNTIQLGGINTNVPGFSTSHPTPTVVTYADRFLLLNGSRTGTLRAYEFDDPTATFPILEDSIAGLDVGGFSDPALADFDGDGLLELVVGNERGGVSYYLTDLEAGRTTSLFAPVVQDFSITAFPNPTAGRVELSDLPGTQVQWLSVIGSDGRLVRRVALPGVGRYTLELGDLPGGLYLVSLRTEEGVATVRLIKK